MHDTEKDVTVYLDNNATTPLAPEVLEAMLPFLREDFGNPSSIHRLGRRAQDALARSRGTVAELIGADTDEIVFTAGGTEADNLAILGTAKAAETGERKHLVASNIEHHAVFQALRHLERNGWEVTIVDVNDRGRIAPERLVEALRPDTLLVSIMYANNETGVLQPIPALASAAHDVGALFHTDAVQACGKIPVDVTALGVDLLSLSAHKFYGPNGVGALYVRRGVACEAMLLGGGQERARRAGTENLPGIVGLAEACRQVQSRLERESRQLTRLRDELQSDVLERIAGARVNGSGVERTPNTVNFRFESVDGRELVMALDAAGFAVSTGAACDTGGTGSHVLTGMGLNPEAVRGSVRVSLGRYTREGDIRDFSEALESAVEIVRTKSSFAKAR